MFLGKSQTRTRTTGFGLVQTGSQSVRDRTSPTLGWVASRPPKTSCTLCTSIRCQGSAPVQPSNCSASITANRAQQWLEPYAQCLELGQWHSHTALAACTRGAAKQVQLPEVMPGGGTGAAAPGPSTTPSTTAPTWVPLPSLWCLIWALEYPPRMAMPSWEMLQWCLRHRR